MKAPLNGKTYQEDVHAPTIVSRKGVRVAYVGEEVKLDLFKLKGWCVLQDLVLDVWELILTQVPVK